MNFSTEDKLWIFIETTYNEKSQLDFLYMVVWFVIKILVLIANMHFVVNV